MKRVLVAGRTSGIGAAIAAEFAAEFAAAFAAAFAAQGDSVVVTGATAAEAKSARALRVDARVLDVRDGAAAGALLASFTVLDMRVNGAGVIRRGAEHEPAVVADTVDINVNGRMRVCAAARPLLAAARACIVNTASMLSFFGGGLVPAYSASKRAPGWTVTPLTQGLQDDPARRQAILARTAMGRWGTPDDVAGPVFGLASAAARFVTGSWCKLLRVQMAGLLSRHSHPSWVTGSVVRGAWRYLEHDWAPPKAAWSANRRVRSTPLVVDEQAGATEMITFFNIAGAMVCVGTHGRTTGYEDMFTKIAMCRKHDTGLGLGADCVDQCVRQKVPG